MHPPSRRRYLRSLPFQVFSCWNGMVVVGADAFLEPDATRFRSIDASDFASEAYLFNVDMWKHGRGKIAVVPKVKLAYSLADYDALHDGNDCDNGDLEAILSRKTAQAGGERHIELVNPEEEIIWLRDPPALVDFRPFNFHRPLFEEVSASSCGYSRRGAVRGEAVAEGSCILTADYEAVERDLHPVAYIYRICDPLRARFCSTGVP